MVEINHQAGQLDHHFGEGFTRHEAQLLRPERAAASGFSSVVFSRAQHLDPAFEDAACRVRRQVHGKPGGPKKPSAGGTDHR